MFKLLTVSVVVLLFAGSTVVLADDIQPPPWRGEWSTTFQYWEFWTDNPGDPTGAGLAPHGPGELVEGQPGQPYTETGYLSSTMLWIQPFNDWIQIDTESGREGIWPLSGTIDVVVDNHDPQNDKKIVWLQVTWRERTSGGHPDVPTVTPVNQAGHITTVPELVGAGHVKLDPTIPESRWYESTYTWEIYPNPVDEWFTIGGDIEVDEIVIDTWCIPEPATLALLVLGGLTLLRRRRK